MALRKIFCPECGQETQIDENKEVCFCLQCGNKIVIGEKAETERLDEPVDDIHMGNKDEIAEKLDEVAFYYQLSCEKKEEFCYQEEPVYYIKAQDILVDLSEIYPGDYRIWWELCKPIDFLNPASGSDIYDKYHINSDFFGKALDRAPLSVKKSLIKEHDDYVQKKNKLKEERLKRRREEEKQKEQENIERKQKIEEELREREQEEKRNKEEKLQQSIAQSTELWEMLRNRDYSLIDNSYFEMNLEDGQKFVFIFKAVSRVLYLTAFRIDSAKGNTIYREQSVVLCFDESGHGLKINGLPIAIKYLMPPNNILHVVGSGEGEICVNGMELKKDSEYIAGIMKCAKKTMFSSVKIFF